VKSEKRPYVLKARAEAQAETRQRIVQATMELHRDIGPAQTTVAEIARRAGVQRMTVYNHFPDEAELFGACQAHWMSLHPFPDPTPQLGIADPEQRVTGVLTSVYGWYRDTAAMVEKVQRDRGLVPALDDLMRGTADAMLEGLAEALAAGFRDRGRRASRRRALARLSLDYWTWRRLEAEGLDARGAAQLMAGSVAGA
jgi:AcrR family transcriptional regulator